MSEYSVAEVAEALSDTLQEDPIGEHGVVLFVGDEDSPITRDPWWPVVEAPEAAWFFLVGPDGRRFAVTVTEVPENR